jgi:hypothetical protein
MASVHIWYTLLCLTSANISLIEKYVNSQLVVTSHTCEGTYIHTYADVCDHRGLIPSRRTLFSKKKKKVKKKNLFRNLLLNEVRKEREGEDS